MDEAATTRGANDASPLDAGPLGAGSLDAGPVDASPLGAGPVYAGPLDGGPLDGVVVRTDDLSGPEIAALLAAHGALMEATSPPGSCHYLPIDGLRRPDVTVWTAWDGATLVACGALKAIDAAHGEVKSMHTAEAQRGRGLGRLMLSVIVAEAEARGYRRLSLETGAGDAFLPARTLYERHRFVACGPFADYREDPASAFFTRDLAGDGASR